ncbi:MAG TPA: hypothetical protein PKB10_08540 [Tepidisphaeraceae bacterium]|nr:hypothetical protein [Tepidisphaeraceae bacterium]
MWFDFRWIEFNEARIAEHGITTEECEWVVCHVRPRQSGTTLIAEGQTQAGRDIRVIYTMDDAMTVFVIIAYEV